MFSPSIVSCLSFQFLVLGKTHLPYLALKRTYQFSKEKLLLLLLQLLDIPVFKILLEWNVSSHSLMYQLIDNSGNIIAKVIPILGEVRSI